jgi:ferric-dicitrate binding protein FerR (iron transport regulator)
VWRLAGEARLVIRRPEGQPPLVVALPQGELVADRAEVDLATTATEARIAVRRGEVELRNPHGTTTVWAGATATVTAAAAPKLGPPLRVVTLTRR